MPKPQLFVAISSPCALPCSIRCFRPLAALPGIGPKIGELLCQAARPRERRRLPRRRSACFTRRIRLIDRRQPARYRPRAARRHRHRHRLASIATSRRRAGKPTCPYRVFLHDDTGELALTFFRVKGDWLEKHCRSTKQVIVSGKVDWFNGRASMVHPDYMVKASEAENLPLVEPVYGLTAGLSPRILRKSIEARRRRVPDMPEWIDVALAARQGLSRRSRGFPRLHEPRDARDLDPQAPARRRLAYDEFLAGQLSLALVRQRLRKVAGTTGARDRHAVRPGHPAALPFSLTGSQSTAIADILKGHGRPNDRMLRLLQGDVGSGKTVVALMAMLAAVESGGQAVLMAPTEILARQHYATLSKMAAPAGIALDVLTGRHQGQGARRDPGAHRVRRDAHRGRHARPVPGHGQLRDLTLAVVDEQHRFGVHQRLRLTAKGISPHMLVMTATPIPRTLVLAAFGDMDVSKLTEKPAGRKPIQTVTIPTERDRRDRRAARRCPREGKKAYWICPLVEESEAIDVMSAEERYTSVSPSASASDVGLVHGRMSGAEKDAIDAGLQERRDPPAGRHDRR